jgi:hypothetical protein
LISSVVNDFNLEIPYGGRMFCGSRFSTGYAFVMNSAGLLALFDLYVCDLTELNKRKPHFR